MRVFVLLTTLLLVGNTHAAKPDKPVLCVAVQGDPTIGEDDLVAALRARVARPRVRVARCQTLGDATPTWQLLIERVAPRRVDLTLTGQDLWARRFVSTEKLNREEVVQQIALTAAEAVRPSIDNALATTGASPPPEEDLVETLEKQVCPPPEPCPEPEVLEVAPPSPVVPSLTLSLSPMVGIPTIDLAGYLELRAGVSIGPLGIAAHLGGRNLTGWPLEVPRALGGEMEFGIDALWHVDPVLLSIRAQSRLAAVSAGEDAPDEPVAFAWRGGLGGLAELALWRGGPWELSLLAQMWLWPQPNRFLVRGEPDLTQAHVELAMGIGLSFYP